MDHEIFISYAHADGTSRQSCEDCIRLRRVSSIMSMGNPLM